MKGVEVHMIRKKRGRPKGPHPLFVEQCVRLDATMLLAKSRGARVDDEVPRRLAWTAYGLVLVTWTRQPFGGVRQWFECPACGRRCGVLLLAEWDGLFGCRRCLPARYLKDYPGRERRARFLELFAGLTEGSLESQRERDLTTVSGPRRRGVRRGRRVLQRGFRLLRKVLQEQDGRWANLDSFGKHLR